MGICFDCSKYYRMDVIWSFLGKMKRADGLCRFAKLAGVVQLVLTLPHSNAQEERVFSIIGVSTVIELPGQLLIT